MKYNGIFERERAEVLFHTTNAVFNKCDYCRGAMCHHLGGLFSLLNNFLKRKPPSCLNESQILSKHYNFQLCSLVCV